MAIVLLDAGTPLLWAAGFQLILGNLFIGAIEWYFVKRFFYRNIGILLPIIANYFSMILGIAFIAPYVALNLAHTTDFYGWRGSYNLRGLALGMAAAFVASIVLEWPFYHLAIRRRYSVSYRKSLWVTFLAQVVSYMVLLLYYGYAIST